MLRAIGVTLTEDGLSSDCLNFFPSFHCCNFSLNFLEAMDCAEDSKWSSQTVQKCSRRASYSFALPRIADRGRGRPACNLQTQTDMSKLYKVRFSHRL